MTFDEASIADQLAAFEQLVRLNPIVTEILERMPSLELPDCWLAAGGLNQTVWNVLSDREPEAGILDYDVNYFDASDRSWEAEDEAIAAAAAVFDGIGARVEVRNQVLPWPINVQSKLSTETTLDVAAQLGADQLTGRREDLGDEGR